MVESPSNTHGGSTGRGASLAWTVLDAALRERLCVQEYQLFYFLAHRRPCHAPTHHTARLPTSGMGWASSDGDRSGRRRRRRHGGHAWRVLVLCLCLLVGASCAAPTLTEEQFEMMDRVFSSPDGGPITTSKPIEAMSDEELEAEMRDLVRMMRPPRGEPFPKMNLDAFQEIHDALAKLLDPEGKHHDPSTHHRGRRLSYVTMIISGGYAASTIQDAMSQKV